ncbi:dihydrofolate reductase family protein [Nonomuraea sp. NPDC050451]|uniref:dihydrofolate reductase family protein n=1 Tax=Nonomuraea sp. NPDC050451 TaxID=3364364 RepID=UPI0037B677B4
MGSAFRLARLVAVVVSVGFSYGGFIGIFRSGDTAGQKALGCGLLVGLLLLHLYNCVRAADGRRPTAWQWTLALQAVLTGAGLHLFASTWYGNTGFLAAAVLLLIRPAALAWAGFAVIVLAQFLSGLEVRPTVWDAAYLAVGHTAFVGLALYGVARFADLVRDMERTRTALADAEVTRERLAFAQLLNERVGTSIEEVVRHGDAVRESSDPPAVRERLSASLATEDDGDLLVYGSGELVNCLIKHELLDELKLFLHPVVVGKGKRLFADGIDTTAWCLAGTHTFSGGAVVLDYRPAQPPAA